MPPHLTKLLALLDAHQARIGILGLGYAGLPLVQAFAARGFAVLGFDTDPDRVASLQRGDSYLSHLPSSTIQDLLHQGFEATNHMQRLGEPDVLLLCLPSPLTEDREPDLRYIIDAVRSCAAHLRPGQLIVLESTTWPGTTRQVVLPALEVSGLRAGNDFFLAYSPERIDPGNVRHVFAAIPRVVGAVEPWSLQAAVALYSQVVSRVVPVASAEVAEASKLLENTYRAVNVALVNEMKAILSQMGIDVWDVIEAAGTKSFGFQPFYPGPGLGGSCIPINPVYLSWAARRHGATTPLIDEAGRVNAAMPAFVASKVAEALNEQGKPVKGSKITLLGVAYKPGVADARESPAWELIALLQGQEALVCYNDPYIPRLAGTGRYAHIQGESQPLTADHCAARDCILIVTDHPGYDWDWIVAHASLVVDTRNATRNVKAHRERIVKA